MTTVEELGEWLDRLYESADFTHLIVTNDTLGGEPFPIYIRKDQDILEGVAHLESLAEIVVLEVYSRKMSKAEQLALPRTWNVS